MRRIFIVFALVMLVCGSAIAQQRTGNIYGTIVDEAGVAQSRCAKSLVSRQKGKMGGLEGTAFP